MKVSKEKKIIDKINKSILAAIKGIEILIKYYKEAKVKSKPAVSSSKKVKKEAKKRGRKKKS